MAQSLPGNGHFHGEFQGQAQGCSYYGGLFHTCGLELEIILKALFLEDIFLG